MIPILTIVGFWIKCAATCRCQQCQHCVTMQMLFAFFPQKSVSSVWRPNKCQRRFHHQDIPKAISPSLGVSGKSERHRTTSYLSSSRLSTSRTTALMTSSPSTTHWAQMILRPSLSKSYGLICWPLTVRPSGVNTVVADSQRRGQPSQTSLVLSKILQRDFGLNALFDVGGKHVPLDFFHWICDHNLSLAQKPLAPHVPLYC